MRKTATKRAALDPRPTNNRSRLTNGAALLGGVDGRSAAARRYRDLASAIVADQGGADRCSEARLQLIRRFAAASVLAEQLEAKLANGEAIDIATHAQLASTLVRLSSHIGLGRHAKVVPSLSEYLETKAVPTD